MRPLRLLLRGAGWLLTPLVAWAASFLGAWAGARGGNLLANSTTALLLTVGLGAAGAGAGVLLWMRLLRRSPRLRRTLALTGEGVPEAALPEAASREEGRGE